MKTDKELKEEYKHIKYKTGVYQIRNKANNKIFVGSSPDLNTAWNSHKFQLEIGAHRNNALQQDWNTCGAENFSYEILEEFKIPEDKSIDVKKELSVLEQIYLDELKPYDEKGGAETVTEVFILQGR